MGRTNWLDARSHYGPWRAAELAASALQVYERPLRIEAHARSLGYDRHFQFMDVEATQVSVAASYERIVVSFRGSESKLEDWVADLDVSLVSGPFGGRVHEGFYDALASVWRLLDDEVRELQRERPRELWVTGHSLGGALAALAAAKWAEAGVELAGVYTFGQPRVGDADFARGYDFALRPRSFRVVNHLDIVTRVPARAMGYSHCGTLVYLTDEGQVEHDECWWRQFLTGWCGTIDTIFDWCGEGIEDHSMVQYCARMESLLPTAVPRPAIAGLTSRGKQQSTPLSTPRRRAA